MQRAHGQQLSPLSNFLQQISFSRIIPGYTRSPKRTFVICWCRTYTGALYATQPTAFKALKGNISSSVS